MDNFRITKGFGVKGFKTIKTKLDKGHNTQFAEYIKFLKKGGRALIEFDEVVNVTRASFASILSLKESRWVQIKEYETNFNF